MDLTGRYLTDDATQPRKWAFPNATRIPAGGFLVVWADEDGQASEGLHANFKLAAGGEQLYLIDSDANENAILDSVIFGEQAEDRSYGRLPDSTETWGALDPTPGSANR